MDFVIQKTNRKLKLHNRNHVKEIQSVKVLHDEKMEYFRKLQEEILEQKKRELLTRGEDAKLQKEIKDIEDRVEELDYYYKNSRLLDAYFSLRPGVVEDEEKKRELISQYYFNLGISDIYYKFKESTLDCQSCDSLDSMTEGTSSMVCTNCGLVTNNTIIVGDLSYKEMQENYTSDSVDYKKIEYKRVDYFKQWLNQLQAREDTKIPQELIDILILELKKEKIANINKLNPTTMKRLLKKTGYSNYYEHIPTIIYIINKLPPLKIPITIENKLINMFEEIQLPWELHKPPNRKNFFSYPYILYKFCQILDLKEYLQYFPLLKSRDKLYKQDIIWQKIVNHIRDNSTTNINLTNINWRFISSV